jgi:catechol 2,3-dioxygenase-like lactoylglutathione lyase family enzyme
MPRLVRFASSRAVAAAAVLAAPLLLSACAGMEFGQRKNVAAVDPLLDAKPYAVTISVEDIETQARWYRDKLGFSEVARQTADRNGLAYAILARNGYHIELVHDGRARSGVFRPDPPAHTTLFGVTQLVFETSDLNGLKAALEARGAAQTGGVQVGPDGARSVYLRDPEGNLVQFLQRPAPPQSAAAR